VSSRTPAAPDRHRSLAVRLAAAVASMALVGGFGLASAAPASAAPSPIGTPSTPTPTASFEAGRYVVTLRDDAVASYDGSKKSYAATRPKAGDNLDVNAKRAVSYAGYLETNQADVASSVGADIISSYTVATNGFTSSLSAEQAAALAADPRVAEVTRDELLHPQAVPTSSDFLGLSGADGVWEQTGGVSSAGEGIVVGVIDSGIAPENPAFAGEPLGTTAGADPYLSGDDIRFDKSDGSTFVGQCVTGEQFAASACSTKIVSAKYYVANYDEDSIGEDRGEYLSPRDGSGHGSHTASTAAGNNGIAASIGARDLGDFSGVVPGARIAAYKVCWSGHTPAEDGCATGDLLAAIDAAVADGVDVINFSIGGGAARSTVSLTDGAFLNAAIAGIFVAASAGNDGPGPSTADNASPWITTVAASTIPSYEATVELGDGATYLGGSITVPVDTPVTGPFVAAGAVATAGTADPQLCAEGSLDPALAAGTIVLCERGVVDRVAKSAEVARAGGIGMVLVNPTRNSLDVDTHAVPTIHVDADAREALIAYAATTGATVTLQDGNPGGLPSAPTPQVADFSSRGPILVDGGDMLKPDIAAPGVGILAGYTNAEGAEPQFALLSGTSMASPHVAGLAALYLGEHPDASPAEVKSAMMTTAYDTVDAAGAPAEDPFAQGAGHVDPTSYLEPGLLYLNDVDDWYGYVQGLGIADTGVAPIDGSDLNLASIAIGSLAGTQTVTRTVTATAAGSYTAQPVAVPGVDVTVSPATLSFAAAGESADFTVTFTRTTAPIGEYSTGMLRWVDGATEVVSPLAVRPVVIAVPSEVTGEGTTGSTTIPVSAGETVDVPMLLAGLVKGSTLHGSGRAGDPADRHIVTVPEGVELARFDLASSDEDADLDLRLYGIDDAGFSWLVDSSESQSGIESIDVPGLAAGRYIVEVDYYSGDDELEYDLTSYMLAADSAAGALTADPSTLSMKLGQTASVAVSWTGLDTGAHYLARVAFGTTGGVSMLTVAAGGTPAPVADEPTVSVNPDWSLPERDVAVSAGGLGGGADYTVTIGDLQVATGVASDAGRADRYLRLPAELTAGNYTVRVASTGGSAETTLHVAPLVVQRIYEVVEYGLDGAATTTMTVDFIGAGTVHVELADAAGTVLDENLEIDMGDPANLNAQAASTPVATPPGDYTAEVSVAGVDDADAQRRTVEFTVAEGAPQTVTLTQNPDDENLVDLVFDNQAGLWEQTTLRYKLSSGPLVFSSVFINKPVITETFDMTGAVSVDYIVRGQVLASYANPAPSKWAAEPKITQSAWATLADKGPTGVADQPISVVFSNRYAVYSAGFNFDAGVGSSHHEGVFHYEQVQHPVITTPGPVIERPTTAPVGQPLWFRALFEQFFPDQLHTRDERMITTTAPVTLAMLAPVVEQPGDGTGPGDAPGDGTDPGQGTSPADGTTPGSGGTIAATGFEGAVPTAIAALLLLTGLALVVARSRRRAD